MICNVVAICQIDKQDGGLTSHAISVYTDMPIPLPPRRIREHWHSSDPDHPSAQQGSNQPVFKLTFWVHRRLSVSLS
jgi:hypothetical protein